MAQGVGILRLPGMALFFLFLFFLYKIHTSPDTGVNNGVWWWGPLSSADQRSRLHSSMDAQTDQSIDSWVLHVVFS